MGTPIFTGVHWKHSTSDLKTALWTEMQVYNPLIHHQNSTRWLWHFLAFSPSLLLPHTWLRGGIFLTVIHSNKHTSSHIPCPHPLPSRPCPFTPLNHLPPCLHIQIALPCFCKIHSLMRTSELGSKCLILDLYIVPNLYNWLELFREMFMMLPSYSKIFK